MSKFSVKKPFTVFVMIVVMVMVGAVSLTKMQMDLLPEISLPYLIVITTYPGASPEKVETTISEPMESSLGTVSGVKNVVSFSYENYSMVELEFEEGTDMDSVLVKVSTAVDTVHAALPEECGIPSIMELSTDMVASEYLAVAYEGKDMEELSRFVESDIMPEFERLNGVASVTTMGLIDQTLQIELNQDKVNDLNAKILAVAQDALDDGREQLDDAKQQLEDAQAELDDGKQELMDNQVSLNQSIADLADSQAELDDAKQELEDGKEELSTSQNSVYEQLAEASEALEALETYQAQLLSQQATQKAVNAAIEAIKKKLPTDDERQELADGLSQAKSGLEAINTLLDSVNTIKSGADGLSTALTLSTEEELTAEEVGQLDELAAGIDGLKANLGTFITDTDTIAMISAALDTTGLSTGNRENASGKLSAYSVTLSGIITMIETQKATIEGTISNLQPLQDAITAADTMLVQYQTEKTSIDLEVKVTEGIISEYEKKLKEMGVSYQDIEQAKLEAAAGFGSAEAQLAAGEAQLDAAQAQLDSAMDQLESAVDQLNAGWDQIESGQEQIDDGWESYYDGLEQFEIQAEQALRSANADQLLTLSALSGLIYAQNFEMPAGYIDDAEDNSWLLKVGNGFAGIEDMENMVLCHIDDVGDVKLGDVADLTIIDNTGTTYARLNKNSSVILSIFKASTSGTNEVSKECKAAIDRLEEKYDGLDIMVLTDQGDYIDIIVGSVVSNMVVGAALAILILAIFLRDFMPTLVVAISIPLSVLTALIAMYFSNISLNMMSLSGMALGIGMLVDNSIVVIENIYRLRGRDVGAPRAAVQGTKQVAGSVIASTLTTVCVFLPMIYTTGLVRELLLPMAFTIIYCLMASLFIAMTVVPAACSTLLKNTKPKEHKLFDKIQEAYGKTLYFCLKVKIVPLSLAIGLLALSVWLVMRMGIVMIPEMTSNQIQASVYFEDDTPRETAYSKMDEFISKTIEIEGIDSVGVMTGGGTALIATTDTDDYLNYSVMVMTEDEKIGAGEVNRICNEMQAAADELGIEVSISSGMGDMGSLLGSGLSISVYGKDNDTLIAISKDIMDIVSGVEGYVDVSNGQEEAAQVLHLNINRDYAMGLGLSVAQMYQELATEISTSVDSVSVTIDGVDMDVQIVDNMDPLTYENLMDYTFEVSEKDDNGNTIVSDVPLSELATIEVQDGLNSIQRKNQSRYITVTASVAEGYNATLLSRELEPLLEKYEMPEGYAIEEEGESEAVTEMLGQMALLILMGSAFIYLVMVAQFQSLLSPFIVLFTLPLAFTGGLLSLWITGEQISVISLMGFVVLLGTVVNNGIVFVDYTNQLRIGGMDRRDALVATGKTRMRPILMTALTTILAEASMLFGDDMGSQLGKGMALVIAGGLAYSTLMTLYIIPVMYDLLFKKKPLNIDTGSEDLDDVPDDAQEFMQQMLSKQVSLADGPAFVGENDINNEAGETPGSISATVGSEDSDITDIETPPENASGDDVSGDDFVSDTYSEDLNVNESVEDEIQYDDSET